VDALIMCESGGSHTVSVLDTNGLHSTGLLQFQMGTWLAYGKPFGATRENITNGELQRIVALHMLNQGGWRHWLNCSNKVKTTLGPYPIPDGT